MIDWQRADILLLDMDGTVLDLAFDNNFWTRRLPQHYAAQRGKSESQARDELLPRFAAAEGRLDWYCVDYWSSELGLDVMALKAEYAAEIAPLPGAEAFLKAQQAAGRRLWLVTNAHPRTLALKLEHTDIGSYFERCISSHDLGFPKEDARFWPAFASHCPATAEYCVMIDDNQAVLDAAHAFGIGQCIRITRPDSRRPAITDPPKNMPCASGLSDLLPA